MESEFNKWYKNNERTFYCGHYDEKQIAFAAWLEGKKQQAQQGTVKKNPDCSCEKSNGYCCNLLCINYYPQ